MPNCQSAIPNLVASCQEAANSILDNRNRGEFPRRVVLVEVVQGKAFRYRRRKRRQAKTHLVAMTMSDIDGVGSETRVNSRDLLRVFRKLCFANRDHRLQLTVRW